MPVTTRTTFFATIIFLCCFIACKKESIITEPDLGATHFKIENKTNSAINCVLYKYRDHYNIQQNELAKFRLEAGATKYLAPSDYVSTLTCIIDFYSDDYSYTNWSFPYTLNKEANSDNFYIEANSSYIIDNLSHIAARKTLLNNEKPTTWKSINAYSIQNPNISIWDTMAPDNKNFTLSFSRTKLTLNGSFLSTYTIGMNSNSFKRSVDGNLFYAIIYPGTFEPGLLLYNSTQKYTGNWADFNLPNAKPTTDTITMIVQAQDIQNNVIYTMVKQ